MSKRYQTMSVRMPHAAEHIVVVDTTDIVSEQHDANDTFVYADSVGHMCKVLAAYPPISGVPEFCVPPASNGVEDIAERLLKSHSDYNAEGYSEYQNGRHNGIIEGLSYNADKKWTDGDMEQCWTAAFNRACYVASVIRGNPIDDDFQDKDSYFQSLSPQPQFEVEETCPQCDKMVDIHEHKSQPNYIDNKLQGRWA